MVNPPAGFLVTANNRIVDDDYPYHITSEWMTGYRAQRIEEMLGERERHSVTDFERMQHDFLSLPGIETVHRLSRLHPVRQRETRAIERLKSWDGVLSPDSVAATIVHAFTVVFAQVIVRAAVQDPEVEERWMNRSGLPVFEIVSSPWRFQERLLELWDENDPTLVRLAVRGRRDAAGTRSRWRLSSRRSTASRSGSATTRTGGAGGACTQPSSCTRSARPTRSSGASSTARWRSAGPARP